MSDMQLANSTVTERGIQIRNMDDMVRFCEGVAKSGLAPKGLQHPAQIMVAVQHGLELGLSPMQALQSIAVINGRPCLWGDALLGVVRGSGLLEYITETQTGEGDKLVATCKVKRVNEPECVREYSWTDAKLAGDTNKDTYKKFPKRMLQMRARAFALRDTFADVLKGIASADEQADIAARPVHATVEAVPAGKPTLSDVIDEAAEKQEIGIDDESSVHEPVESGEQGELLAGSAERGQGAFA